jgi:hypothetical protein
MAYIAPKKKEYRVVAYRGPKPRNKKKKTKNQTGTVVT